MTIGQELVVLHTTPSMSGRLLVHAWRFERRTFRMGFIEGILFSHAKRC